MDLVGTSGVWVNHEGYLLHRRSAISDPLTFGRKVIKEFFESAC